MFYIKKPPISIGGFDNFIEIIYCLITFSVVEIPSLLVTLTK